MKTNSKIELLKLFHDELIPKIIKKLYSFQVYVINYQFKFLIIAKIFKTRAFMFSAQTDHKRNNFRKQIRNKHIQILFHQNRQQHLKNISKNYQQNIKNLSNNQNIYPYLHNQQPNTLINYHQNKIQKIQQIIQQNNIIHNVYYHNFLQTSSKFPQNPPQSQKKYQHISNQTLKKIWQIVLQSQNQICTNDNIMNILIKNAIHDIEIISQGYKQLNYNQKIQKVKGLKNKCQRIGQILWILSNQCYKNTKIHLQTAQKIVKLCLLIINLNKKNRKSKSNIPNYNNNFQSTPPPKQCSTPSLLDQYIIGLCIILLGNVCISEAHVQCILNNTKISALLQMLDGVLDENNSQDLSFVIANILYYYPEIDGMNENCDEINQCQVTSPNNRSQPQPTTPTINLHHHNLSLKQQQYQLTKILKYLNYKLYIDILLSIHNILTVNDNKNNINSSNSNHYKKNNQQSESTVLDHSFQYSSQNKISYHPKQQYLQSEIKDYSKNHYTTTNINERIFTNQISKTSQKNITNQILIIPQKQLQKIKQILTNINKLYHIDNKYGIPSQKKYKQSENYTNDIMQCICKIKSILYSLYEKQYQHQLKIYQYSLNKQKNCQQFQIQIQSIYHKFKLLHKQIDNVRIKIYHIQKDTFQLIIKLLFILQDQNKKQNSICRTNSCFTEYGYVNIYKQNITKLKNTITFLRDIYRSFQFLNRIINKNITKDSYFTLTNTSHNQSMLLLTYKQNTQLQQLLLKNYGTPFLNYIHKLILIYYQNYQQNNKNNDQNDSEQGTDHGNRIQMIQIQDHINGSVWQIYGYIMSNLFNHQSKQYIKPQILPVTSISTKYKQQLYIHQIQWLQMKLLNNSSINKSTTTNINHKNNQLSYGNLGNSNYSNINKKQIILLSFNQQCKVIELLTKYYPISNNKYQYKKNIKQFQLESQNKTKQKLKNIFKLSQRSQEQTQQQSYEFIQIDIYKVREILSILHGKLIEFHEYPFVLCAILRGILTILTRQKSKTPQNTTNTNTHTNNNKLQLILGSNLYNYLSNQLLDKYGGIVSESDNICGEIGQIVQEILNNYHTCQMIQEDQHCCQQQGNIQINQTLF